MNNILNTEISNIQFLNKRQIYLFNKYYNIYSYKDFIYYSPIKYIDRRTFTKICFINKNVYFVQFKCIITRKKIINNNKILYVYGKDDTGEIPLIWFRGIHKMNCFIKLNLQYIVFGKVNIYNDNISIIHPEIDNIASYTKKYQNSSYTPIYKIKSQSKYIKINSNVIKKIQLNIINIIRNKIKDTLSEYIIYKYNLCSFFYAIKNLHFPINNKAILISKYRLKFEELFNMHKNILLKKEKNKKNNIAYSLNKIGDLFNKFYKKYLPFELTNAQKKVIKEIRRDLNSEIQMNRLLQGDVGCGKTIVALMIMLIAIDNKTQTCLMVPSELLAEQHFNFIKNILNKLPVNIELITSSISKKKK
ncbi:MAG: DEAD/DEAH box helicase [Bacteroides sp.]|nr:MAG: DEAD/DEAH box helicase [Bacteroides sp.]